MSWVFVQESARNVRPELLKQGAKSALGGHNEAVGKGLADAGVLGRIVEIRDCAGGDVARHIGVVRLPLACVVMLAHHVGHQGIEHPMRSGAVAEAEVARVLVKQRGENAVSKHRAVEGIQIGRARPLPIALDAPREAHIVVHALVVTGHQKGCRKGDWIDRRAKGQLDLLAGCQRDGVSTIRDIERGHHAQHPLLLLLLELLLGLFVLALL